MLGGRPARTTASCCRTPTLAVVTENELYARRCARAPREREARRSSVEACCATCRRSRSATRWCTRSTASAATSGWRRWISAKAPPSSCTLEYDGGDKLYVPVSQLQVIGRYSGAPPEAAPLHKLGSGQWDKAKRKAAAAGARHRRRAAQPLRAARGAQGPRLQAQAARLRSLRRRLSASRRRPTRRRRSTR